MHTALNTNARESEITSATPVALQIAAEEGRLKKASSEAMNNSGSLDLSDGSSHPPINYPVGKPLEVNSFPWPLHELYDILSSFLNFIELMVL